MNKFPIDVWEWSFIIEFIHKHFPHRIVDFGKSISKNQFTSKTWLIENLMLHSIVSVKNKEIWILGSWYGTILVPLIRKHLGSIKTIHLVDYDQEALEIASILHGKEIKTHCMDVNFDFPEITGDLIINTSCEHMYPMNDYKFNGLCVFQSNNFTPDAAHINCPETLDDFIAQCGLSQIEFAKEIQFHDYDEQYKRFMIIGKQ
jgi:hypothetical protein